jgi:hypothetical protein
LRLEYIHKSYPLECVEPLDITGFLLFGSEIEMVCNTNIEIEENLFFDLEYHQ